MKQLGVFLLPPGWDASPSQATPSYAGTHLYTWLKRSTVRVKCLAQEHNTMSLARHKLTRKWPIIFWFQGVDISNKCRADHNLLINGCSVGCWASFKPLKSKMFKICSFQLVVLINKTAKSSFLLAKSARLPRTLQLL